MQGMAGSSQAGYIVTSVNAQGSRPTPQPVVGACEALANAGDMLHDRITALEQRLSAILSPLPPAGVAEGKPSTRHSLALQIESEASKVCSAVERIEQLINRLEL